MSNIVGEEFEDYVGRQIKQRQKVHSSGVNNLRDNSQISYLNSKTSWVKFASAVSVTKEKLTDIGINNSNLVGMGLAKNNILFGGTSTLNGSNLNPKSSNVDLSGYQHSDEWGIIPMPGIESVDIKTLNRGSIEKATIKLKAYSREQFDIIDILYLRLGYTVLLEWGVSSYISNDGTYKTIGGTLVEDPKRFFSDSFGSGGSFLDLLGPIEYYRKTYNGNYDGLLGKISNFNWSFNPDGSYDITVTVVSLGDVVESLKTNLTPNNKISTYIQTSVSTLKSSLESEREDTRDASTEANRFLIESPTADDISAMLWVWKYKNKDKIINNLRGGSIAITTNSGKKKGEYQELINYIGNRLYKTPTDKETLDPIIRYDFYIGLQSRYQTVMEDPDVHFFGSATGISSTEARRIAGLIGKDIKTGLNYASVYGKKYSKFFSNQDFSHRYFTKGFENDDGTNKTLGIRPEKVEIEANEAGVVDPLQYITRDKPCFYIRDEQPRFYLKFGALLEYIKNGIIPATKTNSSSQPILNIDLSPKSKMYSIPNQISLDPRVCLVRNDKFQKRKSSFARVLGSNTSVFRVSDSQKEEKKSKYINAAYIMNIYLNFDFITDSLDSNKDTDGNANLYGFISSLCDGLNVALGGINNLEPTVDKTSNILKIIDSTPIPGILSGRKSNDYTLEMYGYNPNTKGSNFVRDINLKTAITPEYATMVTVGATAGGYVKGVEATAFSNWNKGLTDRFNNELQNNITAGDENEAEINYVKKFLNELSLCYGFSGIQLKGEGGQIISSIKFNEEAIDSNVGIVTEFYRFLQSKNRVGNSMGFIPFKLGLTLDGISGIKIYNKLNIDSRFLPSNYGKTLDLLVTGISHKLSNNDWTTEIETTAMPEAKVLSQGNLSNISWGAVDDIIDSTIELNNIQENAVTNIPTEISQYTPSSGTPLLEAAVRDQFTLMYNFEQTPSTYTGRILSEEGDTSTVKIARNNSAEISGLCAGYSYNGILELKNHIDAKSTKPIPWTWKGSGDAYANSHLDKIQATNGGNFYTKTYVGFLERDKARKYINEQTWNYGDVVNYRKYQNESKGEASGFHTQVYTGNIFSTSNFWKNGGGVRVKGKHGNSGWSTSNATNYGSPFVYSEGKYHVYVFKVKEEFLI